jgi:hypothetical protein
MSWPSDSPTSGQGADRVEEFANLVRHTDQAHEALIRVDEVQAVVGPGVAYLLPVPALVEVVLGHGLKLGGIELGGLNEAVRGETRCELFGVGTTEIEEELRLGGGRPRPAHTSLLAHHRRLRRSLPGDPPIP